MLKYFKLFLLHWQSSLTYPTSFFFWRLRQFLSTLSAMTVWQVLFQSSQTLFNFSAGEMNSYVFLAAFLQSVILATSLNGLAENIYTGQISKVFLQPFKPVLLFISQEMADKSMNIAFTILEAFLLYWIFKPALFFPTLPFFALFVVSCLLGAAILFIVMLIFGCVGFWSQETWGPRFLFFMFLEITAGKMFPLSILPQWLQQILSYTFFPYLTYAQTQIYLQHYSIEETFRSIGLMLFWIVFLYSIYKFFWNKGLKEYGALGH